MDPENWFSLYKTNQPLSSSRAINQKRPGELPQPITKKIAKNILMILALGAGGALITMSPAGGVYFMIHGAIVLTLKNLDFKREIKRMEKKGYVALTKRGKGFTVKLLKKAERRIKNIVFESLKLSKEEKWDGKWRLFIFDIPEKNRLARDLLRIKLKNLGMYNIQRSVFAYPFDCREELDFIAEHYGIEKYSTFAEVNYLDIDRELQGYFKLKKSVA